MYYLLQQFWKPNVHYIDILENEMQVCGGGGFLFSLKTHLYAFLHVYSTTVEDIPVPHLLLRALCGGFFKIHDGAISHFFWLIQESGVE